MSDVFSQKLLSFIACLFVVLALVVGCSDDDDDALACEHGAPGSDDLSQQRLQFWFERSVSLPPRRIAALPDLSANPATSTVTLGRDS